MTTGATQSAEYSVVQITEYTVRRGGTSLAMSRRTWPECPDREFWLIQAAGQAAQIEGFDNALYVAETLAAKMEEARALRETAAQIETQVGQTLRAIPFPLAP